MAAKIAPITGDIPWPILIKNCEEHVPNEIRVHVVPICKTLETAIESNELSQFYYNFLKIFRIIW